MSCKTMSAMTGEKEEWDGGALMKVPKICLYVMLLNEKYIELRISLTASMNSTEVIEVLLEIRFHLFTMLCMAKSVGIFVKSEITSSDAITHSGSTLVSFSLWTK